MKRPLLRPAVHAGAFAFSFLPFVAPSVGKWEMVGVALAALVINAFLLPRTSLGRSLRREGEPLWNGQLSYPLAVAFAYAVFDPATAQASWAVMAIGDPAAYLVGTSREWKARIPWNRRKSAAGSAAFLGAAWAAAAGIACLWVVRTPLPLDTADVLLLAGAGALAGAVVETIPFPVDDNIPVTLAAGTALLLAGQSLHP